MDVKDFDSLSIRDFENGAIRDDIRKDLKQLADIREKAGVEKIFQIIKGHLPIWLMCGGYSTRPIKWGKDRPPIMNKKDIEEIAQAISKMINE